MKSPLFQIFNNYFRIFRCYQKKEEEKEKEKENLRKKQISDKMQELKKQKIQLTKQNELEGNDEEILDRRAARSGIFERRASRSVLCSSHTFKFISYNLILKVKPIL